MYKALARTQRPGWYPGQLRAASPGRPPVYTEHVKNEVARVAMDFKRKRMEPTPRRVRARLPLVTCHPDTGKCMSPGTMRTIFTSRCFDTRVDDPWLFLPTTAQDYLPSDMKPQRVACARHILRHFPPGAWYNHVALDPCSTLLPRTPKRLEEQQVAAMGKNRWMSPKSRREGANLRAPSTATKQKSGDTLQLHWTPVFSRGKIYIHVCDPALLNASHPAKLNDSANLSKFVVHVLPGILDEMRVAHGWANAPRTVVHDKASYMVTPTHDRLNVSFAGALAEAGMRSWLGGLADSTKWLVPRLGDFYLHETAIAHIRRLLDGEFRSDALHETVGQFKARMKKVEAHMNSDAFAAPGGRGLYGLAQEMRARCEELVRRKGGRLPK